jgi:hypothetical protein
MPLWPEAAAASAIIIMFVVAVVLEEQQGDMYKQQSTVCVFRTKE